MTRFVTGKLAALYRSWEGWWFEPRETSVLAVLRIAYGTLMFLWVLSHIPPLLDFFGSHGILPSSPDYSKINGAHTAWSVLTLIPGNGTVIVLMVVMGFAALAVAAGFKPRIGAAILFVGITSLERRNPYVYDAGDLLLRIMALYLAFAPSGAALSLDRWRKHRDRFWEFPLRTQVTLRLMQLQVSFVYLQSVWAKVRGVHWNDGTAVSIAMRMADLHRFPMPSFLLKTPIFANLMTFSALGIEFAMATLVWNRKARPYVLLGGVLLHLGIDYTLTVGFFSYAIILYYISFLDPPRMSARILRVRDFVRGRLARRAGEPAIAVAAVAQPEAEPH